MLLSRFLHKMDEEEMKKWNIRDQLLLASCVQKYGENNWLSVSKQMRAFGTLKENPEFYSQKKCARLYSSLVDMLNTPRRKRTDVTGSIESPATQLANRLTAKRIEELKVAMEQNRNVLRQVGRMFRTRRTSAKRLECNFNGHVATDLDSKRNSYFYDAISGAL
ncbi:unnamed protein product [Soboliphyme baturini]|uniref:HTH myb-type domain-containing protein n=1 Tax=Soboliphyme baturini TaxID=241478 RepID=A0A183IPZ0_9BILA|nr:unnamed protein product [Soboliphyme baturini]